MTTSIISIALVAVVLVASAAATLSTSSGADSSSRTFEVVRHGHRQFSLRQSSIVAQKTHKFTNKDVAAIGTYNTTLMQTGWDVMTVVSNAAQSDQDQAYAAGYFEGTQTWKMAREFLNNAVPHINTAEGDFLKANLAYVRKIATNTSSDAFLNNINLILEQWEGILAGMNAGIAANNGGSPLTEVELMQISSYGDLFDISPAVSEYHRGDWWNRVSKKEFQDWKLLNSHCSALFKIVGNFEDIFFGHATWNRFSSMTRIFKHITLNFNHASVAAKTISMSSYPGIISSLDDFYVMDSGLVSIETSLSVVNTSIYEGNVKPESLLYWFRVMAANRMAVDAPTWAKIFSTQNSGTYNNQWMVLDTNLFTPGKDLPPNTFWVVEQMPGRMASLDYTNVFRYGYYPSYNVVMNKSLFDYSGGNIAVKKDGPQMNDYQMCVRAQIFRRDQGTVTDLDSFKHIMQYNDYENDPISEGNPLFAIASRADLNPESPFCFGALDAKVSSVRRLRDNNFEVHAYSGPTPQQPMFQFNTTKAQCGSHTGVPESFHFGWSFMKP